MIPLVDKPNWRVSAQIAAKFIFSFPHSTKASMHGCVAGRFYPSVIATYTIRTPSPGGQTDHFTVRLPAFFNLLLRLLAGQLKEPVSFLQISKRRTAHVQ